MAGESCNLHFLQLKHMHADRNCTGLDYKNAIIFMSLYSGMHLVAVELVRRVAGHSAVAGFEPLGLAVCTDAAAERCTDRKSHDGKEYEMAEAGVGDD